MTVEFYSNAISSDPDESEDFDGILSDFINNSISDAGFCYRFKEPQPVSISLNGDCVDHLDWGKIKIKNSDIVKIRYIPHGFVKKAFKKITRAISRVFSFLSPQKAQPSQRQDPARGRQISASSADANSAKLNETVPEIAGRFYRVPEHLVQPRKYFYDPRTLYQEMFLCVGVGEYEYYENLIKIGTTPLKNLEGAEYFWYNPGEDVSGSGLHWNWYTCPEVGSTGAGGAGLELTSSPSSDLDPTAETYVFNDKTMTASPIPAGWVAGTRMDIRITRPYSTEDDGDYSKIIGNFVDIAHLSVGEEVVSRLGERLRIVDISIDSSFDGFAKFDYLNEFDVWLPVKVDEQIEVGYWFVDGLITFEVSALTQQSATYIAIKNGSVFGGWLGFGSITASPTTVYFEVDGAGSIGEWAGPFNACPVSESATDVECDIFFPNGLARVNSETGGLLNRGVAVEIQWRSVGGAWRSMTKTYIARTLDQIGYTEKLPVTNPSSVEVRMRRVGAVSTSSQVYDEVQWYGLRALLKSPTTYQNWTTLGVRFKGLGKIGSGSENKINLVVTRKLPTLNADGTLGPVSPTRDISAFALHIGRSVGYQVDDWDIDSLRELNNTWRGRGETIDFIFNETTTEKALQTTLGAGMSELTIDDGLLRPVREGVRTQYEQAYSAQNTTDGFNRQFTLDRVDSNDGVLVEYIDAQDGYTQKTVECKLPGKAGVRLQKISADGVVGRDRAWRIGMRQARALEYQKWAYRFTTELDAMNSSYGSYVALVPDIANYGRSGLVMSVDGNVWTLSENVEFDDGVEYVIGWRDELGRFVGPFPVVKGVNDFEVVVDSANRPSVKMDRELPHFFFGELSTLTLPALVTSISPSSDGKCSVRAVNYDARIYADDDSLAPQEYLNA